MPRTSGGDRCSLTHTMRGRWNCRKSLYRVQCGAWSAWFGDVHFNIGKRGAEKQRSTQADRGRTLSSSFSRPLGSRSMGGIQRAGLWSQRKYQRAVSRASARAFEQHGLKSAVQDSGSLDESTMTAAASSHGLSFWVHHAMARIVSPYLEDCATDGIRQP